MALYLVQHGISLPKTEDPQKGLSAEGKSETERIAQVAAGYRVPVKKILHSGKTRARQTAEIFATHLSPPDGIDGCEGINPLDDVIRFANGIALDGNLMIVGHLPFLERLIGYWVGGDPERLVFKIQNSGIICLDRVDAVSHPVIKWALMPAIG